MTIEFKNIYILLFYGQHMFVSYLHVPPPLIQQTINSHTQQSLESLWLLEKQDVVTFSC